MSAFVTGVQNSQEITHEKNLVDSRELAENFVRTMGPLGDRLGPLLLQLPPSFAVEGMGYWRTSWPTCRRASATPSRCATAAGSART